MGRVARYKKVSGADKAHGRNPQQFAMGYGFAGSEDRRHEQLAERRVMKRDKQIANGKASSKKQLCKADLIGAPIKADGEENELAGTKRKKKDQFDIEEDKDTKAFREFQKWKKDEESKKTKKTEPVKANPQPKTSENPTPEETTEATMNDMMTTQKELLDEVRLARQIKSQGDKGGENDTETGSSAAKVKFIGQQEGESYSDFKRRLKHQRYQALLKQKQDNGRGHQSISSELRKNNPVRYNKKKTYLDKRKNRKGNKGQRAEDSSDDEDDNMRNSGGVEQDDGFVTGEQAAAAVAAVRSRDLAATGGTMLQNLDQVERPPEFKRLPRGAVAKDKFANIQKNNSKAGSGNPASEQEMSQYMSKIQQQYAKVKLQRRTRGDQFFHL
jgi:hypothetical protein